MGWGDTASTIESIEASIDLDTLKEVFQSFVSRFGFAHFTAIDISLAAASDPVLLTTIPEQWDRDYRSNDFVDVDPVIPHAKRLNGDFRWSETPIGRVPHGRDARLMQLLECTQDHGYEDGWVVPLHYRDRIGAYRSAVVTLFWQNPAYELSRLAAEQRHEINFVLIYFIQRLIDLLNDSDSRPSESLEPQRADAEPIRLSERERDVLTWAARGKSIPETAQILGIADETARQYMKQCLIKLDAVSKTHAVTKAIMLGLITP